MTSSSWREAVWRGSGACAGRVTGARRTSRTAARRRDERSGMRNLEGEAVWFGAASRVSSQAPCQVGLIVDHVGERFGFGSFFYGNCSSTLRESSIYLGIEFDCRLLSLTKDVDDTIELRAIARSGHVASGRDCG